jgi:hypothetical protein
MTLHLQPFFFLTEKEKKDFQGTPVKGMGMELLELFSQEGDPI